MGDESVWLILDVCWIRLESDMEPIVTSGQPGW